jgi:chromosome segregation ATPase
MSTPETILEAIKRSREQRDTIMLQDAIPVLEQLRNMVKRWIDHEFKDFEEEIRQVDHSAPRQSAIDRIEKFRTEIEQIRTEQLPSATKELDSLVEEIKQQSFNTVEDAIEKLKQKIPPILVVMWNLIKARERLDGMAEMIPIPKPVGEQ